MHQLISFLIFNVMDKDKPNVVQFEFTSSRRSGDGKHGFLPIAQKVSVPKKEEDVDYFA